MTSVELVSRLESPSSFVTVSAKPALVQVPSPASNSAEPEAWEPEESTWRH